MLIEPDTTITYASPSAERVLGIPAAALEGTRFADLIPPEDKGRVLTFLTTMAEGEGHTGLTEFRVEHRDGGIANGRDPPHQPAARPQREGDRV